MEFRHALVSKTIVHKHDNDDVLVSNVRKDLPTFLTVDEFDQISVQEEKISYLKKHYRLAEGTQLYVRKSVPYYIPEDSAISYLEKIASYYDKTDSGHVLSSKFIPEITEEYLSNHFVSIKNQIDKKTRHKIYLAFHRVGLSCFSTDHYFSMVNTLDNYYFYRKAHEHVPGTMFVEAARQAMYYHYYANRPKDKRGDVTLSIKKINCEFFNYADSNYPITIRVQTTSDESDGKKSKIDRGRTCFYQNGNPIAEIEFEGVCISLKLFARMREKNPTRIIGICQ
ncbi:MAG: hypothetical protein HRU28_08560 [Rhizobiales bacterium]|nr:hypothetical protein [Hyphomicrobiales bacterium]